MAKTVKIRTAGALAVLACVPAAAAQGDPEPDGPASEPPAAANPMGGTAQPGNLGAQAPSGGPRVSSNAEVERPQVPGPPDFPENNELPEHGGPDLPSRPNPPTAEQQEPARAQPGQEPVAQQQPAQRVSQSAPQAVPGPRPVPDQGPAQRPAAKPEQPQQSGLLPDVGSLVGQVLGFLPHIG